MIFALKTDKRYGGTFISNLDSNESFEISRSTC